MGLIAWFPLDGNLNNKGLSTYSLSNEGNAVVDNAGKIGKCYSFNGSNQRLAMNYGKGLAAKNLSMACWVKPKGSINNKIFMTVPNGNNQRLYVGGYNATYNLAFGSSPWGRTTSAPIVTNQWAHVCVTIDDKNTATLYVDGKYVEKITNSAFSLNGNFVFGGRSDGYDANVCLNDLRIYDHCLSAKEIGELAHALILHYPMNEPDGFVGGRNLDHHPSAKSGTLSVPAGSSGSEAYSIGAYTRNVVIPFGQSYTGSIWVKPSVDCTAYVDQNDYPMSGTAWAGNDNSSNRNTTDSNKAIKGGVWTRLVWHAANKRSGNTNKVSLYVQDGIRFYQLANQAYTVEWKEPKLEFGDVATPYTPAPEDLPSGWNTNTVYDASGYCRNASYTEASKPSWAGGDSPIGLGSFKFSGASCFDAPFTIGDDAISVSFWAKPTDISVKHCYYACRNSVSAAGFNMFTFDNGQIIIDLGGSRLTTGKSLTKDQWTYICVTYKSGEVKLYLNGKQEYINKGAASPLNGKGTKIDIGASSDGTAFPYSNFLAGNMADFRVYATALDGEAIQKLYSVREAITNTGAVLADNFIEDEATTKFGANGVVTAKDFGAGMGRRNWAKNTSADWKTISSSQYYGTTATSIPIADLNIPDGTPITYSFYLKTGADASGYARLQHYNSDDDRTSSNGDRIAKNSEGWTFVTTTVKNKYKRLDLLVGNADSGASTSYQVKYVKLEIGAGKTPWNPALEDTVAPSALPGVDKTQVYDNAVVASGLLEWV